MDTTLRNVSYYSLQETFDELYEVRKNNASLSKNLLKIITSEENIMLAFRNMKTNKGSKTAGVDGKIIDDYKETEIQSLINEIRERINNYKPDKIKRVFIPKSNGKKRPLGIPTIRDRIIQQMFKQVIEPIVEAKFYNHSYGFRPNRSQHHAIARCRHLINCNKLLYVVDIDVKGFFDNVNHNKLIKQLYNIGVKDKRVLTMINKMLKVTVVGEGRQVKGTPQGSILSPILSNVVLNDLDQWIYSQWEGFKTKFPYYIQGYKIAKMKKTSLKERYIVRYADDFKIFTNNKVNAWKIYHAVKGYLKDRLGLEIAEDKSKIIDLRKEKSKFLGYDIFAFKKKNKWVARTEITQDKCDEIVQKARELIKNIKEKPETSTIKEYNIFVMGVKNYFKYATNCYRGFRNIQYRLSRTLYNKLRTICRYEIPRTDSPVFKMYNKNAMRTYGLQGIYLFVFADTQAFANTNFKQEICNYTVEGRATKKQLEEGIVHELSRLYKQSLKTDNIEYADNKISSYSMQKGKCKILNVFLPAELVHCHHIIPKADGGTDEFKNLVIIHKDMHRLIHAVEQDTIKKYLDLYQLTEKQINVVNKYRKSCNLPKIN